MQLLQLQYTFRGGNKDTLKVLNLQQQIQEDMLYRLTSPQLHNSYQVGMLYKLTFPNLDNNWHVDIL
jgi:hypothetical protein